MADMQSTHIDDQTNSRFGRDGRPEPSSTAAITETEMAHTRKPTPLPKVQLFIVLLVQFSESITALVIHPFVNQFVRDTGITKGDDRKTGYYAGIIESAFFFAEAATVFQWGWLSDRIGRRPVLLIGPLGLTLAMLRFGYSTSFWPLVWSRCFQGVFNGNIGVSKTVMAELTDETNIGDVFAMMPLMWSIGSTISPTIGGVFSNPATRWPHIFGKIAVFRDHPYFLPCLIASSFALFTFVVALFGLKETLASIVTRRKKSQYQKIKRGQKQLPPNPADSLLGHAECIDYGTTGSAPCPSPISETAMESCQNSGEANVEPPTLRSILRSQTLQVILINFLLLTFTDMCYGVLLPLIYSTPIELGGLGLTPYAIGLIMGTWGFLNAVVQFNLLGNFIRKHGSSRVYKFSYACFAVCFLTYPVSTYLARRNGSIGISTCISIFVQLLFQFGLYMSYGSIHVVVAETTPKSILGSVNGIVQMIGCTMRTIAPTFASSLFSVSLEKQLAGGYLVYIVLIILVFVGVGCSLLLPERKGRAVS